MPCAASIGAAFSYCVSIPSSNVSETTVRAWALETLPYVERNRSLRKVKGFSAVQCLSTMIEVLRDRDSTLGTSEKPIDRERLRAAVLDLAPWYFDIEVRDGLRTSLYLDAPQRPGTTRVLVRILDSVDGTASLTEAFVPAEHASQAEPHVPFHNT